MQMMKIRKQYLRCVYFTGKLHETKLRLILDNWKFHFHKMTYHLNKLYLKIVMKLLGQNIIFTSKSYRIRQILFPHGQMVYVQGLVNDVTAVCSI